MRWILARRVVVVLFCLLVRVLAMAQSAGVAERLDREVPRLLAENHVPGVSIAVLRHGRIVMERAYGMQDATTKATPRTLYNIASLTKPITAQVAMRLLSQGVFTLDEPMAPVWTDPDIADDARRNLLTPRMALTHQTGFANWRSMTGGKLTFQFEPGTRYGYSGEGFEYLARFMEKKTGVPLDRNAKRLVFDPLGMKETAFTPQPFFIGRVAVPADDKGVWMMPRFADKPISADMVYTTAHDYALLLKAVMANTGITREVAAERDRMQIDVREEMCSRLAAGLCPDAAGSGLSWQLMRFGGTTVMMHGGHDPGVHTLAYLVREDGSGAVILTNGENGKKLYPLILEAMGAPERFTRTMAALMK
ncbi:MAG: serine hydrolase [Edaphobacter sp.]|uniref:serine hydrolase domain-containing protein n=1 Tax=Edaphobacter sp. TaxID=1934404 RepID=UPI0023A08848|nr:serine hydrolase domain-containing protein [Edaphobacter sp.]MDE1175861.1 serine hydrolase [Edaphobacter sp.]